MTTSNYEIKEPKPVEKLTSKEIDVLVRLYRRNGEIAVALGITPRTVEFRIETILRKLQVETRTAAVHAGIEYGYVHVPSAD